MSEKTSPTGLHIGASKDLKFVYVQKDGAEPVAIGNYTDNGPYLKGKVSINLGIPKNDLGDIDTGFVNLPEHKFNDIYGSSAFAPEPIKSLYRGKEATA